MMDSDRGKSSGFPNERQFFSGIGVSLPCPRSLPCRDDRGSRAARGTCGRRGSGDPIAAKLNALPKHVASTTLTSADWHNSSLLGSDVVAEVTKLKEQPGGELQVHGSGALAHTLIEHDLIDEYRLLYFPVHLGSGKKLFRDGARAAALRLASATTTSTGVIIATYQPAGPVQHGSYALDQP
jgi:dihydrofolate reductase